MNSSNFHTTILAMDIVGYSQMMNENHELTLKRLRDARDSLIEPEIGVCSGRVIKRLGDGWLAEFDNPSNATRCAIRIQDKLNSDDNFKVRIGIHLGEASFVDEDVFGTGVNIASRLEALAVPGGIAISENVFSELSSKDKMSFEDAGMRSLKNIAEPVKVMSWGGIPPMESISDTVLVCLEPLEVRADKESSEIAAEILDAVEVELEAYRWISVVKNYQGKIDCKYTVGGAIRVAGNRLRLTSYLATKVEKRRIWSGRFDKTNPDIFELQDELASAVASRISVEIDAYEKSIARMRQPEQMNSTELSVRANDLMSSGRIGDFEEADVLTARAIALEPRNPSAHAQKSFVSYRKAMSGAWPTTEALGIALEAAKEVVHLDPNMPVGYVMLASIYGMMGKPEPSLDAASQVASLNPKAWGAPHGRTIAYAFAPPDWAAIHDPECDKLIENAVVTLQRAETSKFRSGHLFFEGLGRLLRDSENDLHRAISTLERSAGAAGATWWPSFFLALAEIRQGNKSKAVDHLDAARSLFPPLSLTAVEDIFGQSRVWYFWQREIEQLSDFDFPVD